MKAGTSHRVPLSPRALEILESIEVDGSDHVFAGRDGGSISENTMLKTLGEVLGHRDVTVHGFRSSFRDWAAECTDFPSEVVEMALAHVIESETEAAYRRDDLLEKRRRFMNAWDDYCARAEPL